MAKKLTDTLYLYARDLCGNDPDHWELVDEKEPSNAHVEVAELLHVPGFVIHGTFKTENLKPGTYQVALILKIVGQAPKHDEDRVLQFRVCQTNGIYAVDLTQDLHELPTDEWNEFPFADSVEVNNRTDPLGQVHFLINKTGHNPWEEKLLVDAVVIKPAVKKVAKKASTSKKSG